MLKIVANAEIGFPEKCKNILPLVEWASQVALMVKNLPASEGNMGDVGSIPGLGRYPIEGNGDPLQCSCLESLMDRGAWLAAVQRVKRVGHD